MENWVSKKKPDPFQFFWVGRKRANKHLFFFRPNFIYWSFFFSKLAASFQSMEVRNSSFAAFIDGFTSNTYVMVIMSDSTIRKYLTSSVCKIKISWTWRNLENLHSCSPHRASKIFNLCMSVEETVACNCASFNAWRIITKGARNNKCTLHNLPLTATCKALSLTQSTVLMI